MEKRAEIKRIIDRYVADHQGMHHSEAWNKLYSFLSVYTQKNIRHNALIAEQRTIDYIESQGLIDAALEIAQYLFCQKLLPWRRERYADSIGTFQDESAL